MEWFGIAIGLLIVLGIWYSPFPYWTSYWRLWKAVIKFPAPLKSKYKQVIFLIRQVLIVPLWGLLWLLDEILYSDYKSAEIKPVFIIGEPRCGTTLLHRTFAKDSSTFYAVRHIEWRYPFIVLQKIFMALGLNQWLENRNYWPDTEAGKIAGKMHPNRLSDWEEDGIFFEENFLHHYFIFLRFPYVELLEYIESFPELDDKARDKMLNAHHRVLQKVQYLRGPGLLYLSKEVKSHNKIPYYLERYKDARFILTVRHAEQFMSSLIPLLRVSTRAKTGMDPIQLDGWQDTVIRSMRKDALLLALLCREIIPADRLISVYANDYMRNIDVATAEIYRSMGLPLHDDFQLILTELRNNQETRDRGYNYEPLSMEGFDDYEKLVDEVAGQVHKRVNESLKL